jgi:hypothetical protein
VSHDIPAIKMRISLSLIVFRFGAIFRAKRIFFPGDLRSPLASNEIILGAFTDIELSKYQ